MRTGAAGGGGVRAGAGRLRRRAPAGPAADAARDAAAASSIRPSSSRWPAAPAPPTGWCALAAERGYAVERRDPLPGLGLELVTLRLPPGADPAEAIRALEAPRAGGDRRAQPRLPRRARRRRGGPRAYADALLGWPAGGCPARLAGRGHRHRARPGGARPRRRGDHQPRLHRRRRRPATRAHGTAVAELIAGPGRLAGARLYHAAVVGDVPGADPAAGVDDIMRAVDWLHDAGRAASSTSASPAPTTRSSTAASPPPPSAAWWWSPPPATTAPPRRRAIPAAFDFADRGHRGRRRARALRPGAARRAHRLRRARRRRLRARPAAT